jgi:hypothetical protein
MLVFLVFSGFLIDDSSSSPSSMVDKWLLYTVLVSDRVKGQETDDSMVRAIARVFFGLGLCRQKVMKERKPKMPSENWSREC